MRTITEHSKLKLSNIYAQQTSKMFSLINEFIHFEIGSQVCTLLALISRFDSTQNLNTMYPKTKLIVYKLRKLVPLQAASSQKPLTTSNIILHLFLDYPNINYTSYKNISYF